MAPSRHLHPYTQLTTRAVSDKSEGVGCKLEELLDLDVVRVRV